MRLYTYCSYKNGYNGYQYAFSDAAGDSMTEKIESRLVSESIEDWPKEFSFIKGMMENQFGWKIILKKNGDDEGILLISKIEEAANLRKKQMEDKLEDEKIREQVCGIKKEIKLISSDKLESEFFMNAAFVGKLKQVRGIASYYLYDLINDKTQGMELMEYMEQYLEISGDQKRYLLNARMCTDLDKKVNCWKKKMKEELGNADKINFDKEHIRLGMGCNIFCHIKPYVRLEKNFDSSLKKRRNNVKQNVINKLLLQKDFSQEYIMIVMDGGYMEESKKANIFFDMDYIR